MAALTLAAGRPCLACGQAITGLVAATRRYCDRACRDRAQASRSRVSGRCARCGGPVEADRWYCAPCRQIHADRAVSARARRSPPVLPPCTLASIELRYRARLAEIRRLRLAGDPAWSVDGWARRADAADPRVALARS